MNSLPTRNRIQHTDEYPKSDAYIYFTDLDGRRCCFTRTGITAPHYPMHPCYARSIDHSWRSEGPVYVLEDGRLWLSSEWHAYYREHLETPAHAETETRND